MGTTTTTTSTSTTTTTVTTTTVTTSSTTSTSTTTSIPCQKCDTTLYSFSSSCGSSVDGDLMWAGQSCAASIVSSPCVQQDAITLTCPSGNTLNNRAPEVTDNYHPRVLCKV